MDRNGLNTERRLRAIEDAFKRERQQHDLLEKKYARLKRRYVRLERLHNRLLMESHGKHINRVETSGDQSKAPDAPDSVESSPSLRSSTVAVIDLTSPCPGTSSAVKNNSGSLVSISKGMQGSQLGFLSRDDICSESPSSSLESPEAFINEAQEERRMEEKEAFDRESWERSINTLYSTPAPRRRPHVDSGLINCHRALSGPSRQTQLHGLQSDHSTSSHCSPQSAHSMSTHSEEPRTRTRPRLCRNDHSQEQTAARAYGYELEQELEPRTHRHERYRWASDPSPEPSTPPFVASSPLVPTNSAPVPSIVPLPAFRSREQSNEEASLALALFLQQEENIAAYEEYEARLLRESVQQRSYQPASPLSDLVGRQRNIDPDSMTYEELLRLGEEVGDVKKERWRRMAFQVLSSLPTYQWTDDQGEDTCIVCQYNYMPNDRAMTLPCAHVFHEDCVGGWIRENNSCPLCKREIAPI